MDCGPPGSSIHGIFQAGVLDWVALFFSRGSPRPKAMEPYYLSSFICAIVKTDLLQFCRPPCWSGCYRSASLLEHSHTFTFRSLPFQVDSRVTSLKKPVLSLPLFPTVSCAYTYPAEMGWGLGPLLQHTGALVLAAGSVAPWHVGSQFHDQGLNLGLLHCRADS